MIKKYKINYNKLKKSCKEGFSVSQERTLITTPSDNNVHRIFTRSLDKGDGSGLGFEWGRLTCNAQTDEDTVYSLTILTSDDREIAHKGAVFSLDSYLSDYGVSSADKKQLLIEKGAAVFHGMSDILLYEQKGRYLWICLEAIGTRAEFSDFCVYVPGDNFFQTFPEVYRQNGEFFHRYISVFSSMYNDLQDRINSVPELLDLDTAPPQILLMIAGWLGLETDGDFFSDEQLRALLKITFELIKIKGTRRAVEQIIGIFIDEPFYIIENEHGEPHCFTVLINRTADEKLHSRLLFLINQFKPLRTKAIIIFAGDTDAVDSGCYLDVNAKIVKITPGVLDRATTLGGKSLLE